MNNSTLPCCSKCSKSLLTTLLCSLLATVTLPAQQQTSDNAEKEMKLNTEAIQMIRFDFTPPKENSYQKLKEAPLDKDFMQFKSDLRMPRSLTDTTRVNTPAGYVRAEPYTIWTRFGEDPIYDVLPYIQKKWEIHWTLNPFRSPQDENRRRAATGEMYEGTSSKAGAGVGIRFDADKLLYETLTRRGRAIRRNRKQATAWKTYADYLPTLSDSLLFPHFVRKTLPVATAFPAATPKDSATVLPDKQPAGTTAGSLSSSVVSSQIPADAIADYIRQQKMQDSLRQQELLRKDKVRQNAYEIEQQIRAIHRRKGD